MNEELGEAGGREDEGIRPEYENASCFSWPQNGDQKKWKDSWESIEVLD